MPYISPYVETWIFSPSFQFLSYSLLDSLLAQLGARVEVKVISGIAVLYILSTKSKHPKKISCEIWSDELKSAAN